MKGKNDHKTVVRTAMIIMQMELETRGDFG